jgi:IclR family acetate operon transcriptional repressor
MNPLSKVFSIIEYIVAKQDKGATYSQIVAALGLPKSSVHRILKDLTMLAYLNFNPETKRYFGSLRLASIGAEVLSNFKLRDYVRPYLLKLHRETEHTTHLAIRQGEVGVFVDKIESKDFGIKLFSEIGKTFPLHCSSLGKALLAFSSDDTVAKLLESPLEAITENTITDPELFRRELTEVQERGYAFDNQEITRGIICVAAPIFGFTQETIGAISVTFPAYINDDRGIKPEIEAIKKYSNLISDSIGRNRSSHE